jgi:hypothetical protein
MQAGYYGRALDPNRPNDPHDQQAFAYPVYVVFLLAPTVKLPFAEVQAGARWLFVGLTLLSLWFWLRVVNWRPSFATVLSLGILLLSTIPFVQAIKLQQLSLLVAALMAGCLYLLTEKFQLLAGVLLAMATIKPHVTLPLCAWLLLWSLADLRSRWRFFASFVVTVLGLILGGEVLLPGWIARFRAAVVAYRNYTEGGTVLGQLLTPGVGFVLTVGIGIATAVVCYRWRKSTAESPQFALTTALVVGTMLLILPTVAPYNQILLLPGVLLLARSWTEASRPLRILIGIAAACLLWPWVTASALAAASFFMSDVERIWYLPLWTSTMIPVSITACLFMLAVRRQSECPVPAGTLATNNQPDK